VTDRDGDYSSQRFELEVGEGGDSAPAALAE
jgi:hypothetical protein